MSFRFCGFILILCSPFSPELRSEAPPLLAKALTQWSAGQEGLAFTQQTRFFLDHGKVRNERVERYDPSLPDSRRWRLIEVDGQPATDAQRDKWETRKNGIPRKHALASPADYLDLDHAKMVNETPKNACFEIGLRPEAVLLLALEKITVVITVDKESGDIAHVAAALRQPTRS